jgi:hypothetical protein
VVETIRLESGHTLTGIGGSNPSLSAIFSETRANRPFSIDPAEMLLDSATGFLRSNLTVMIRAGNG